MTQSGQGEEPQLPGARPAHEGVVLPADGGEPLIPGTYGEQAVPAGGTPWGQPWGPQAPQAAPSYGQGEHFAPGQAWGQDQQQYPPQDQQQPYGQDPQQPYGQDPQPYGQQQPQSYGQSQPQSYGQSQPEPYGQQQHAQPYGQQQPQPEQQSYGQPVQDQGFQQQPQAQQPPQPQPQQLPQQPAVPQSQGPGGALPPASPLGALPAQPQQPGGALPEPYQSQAGASLPQPEYAQPQPQQGGAPLPPADGEATQYLPPQQPNGPYPGQIPQSGQSEQTGQGAQNGHHGQSGALPGALPPEAPAADATQFLGRQQPAPAAGNPDSEATQYIAPVPPAPAAAPYGIRPGAPGDRQPPAEFDSLFRSEPAAGGSDSTQQMPQFRDAPAQQPPPQQQFAGPPEPSTRRTGSKLPLFAAIGVAIAVLGVGAGALLAAGGDDEKKDEPKNAAASEPASPKASPTVDPAEEQAVALDKLLAESNNSRDAVINSVKSIEHCRTLGKAATDLRGAAQQRNDLVTRLAQLKVDELPKNAELTAALNKAWKSSASADNHYAAWAGQVAAKKGCPKGKPRSTAHRTAAISASGAATKAKEQAASLWNAIAGQYGLTKRSPIQL